jgi:hypothetical protein
MVVGNTLAHCKIFQTLITITAVKGFIVHATSHYTESSNALSVVVFIVMLSVVFNILCLLSLCCLLCFKLLC